MFAKDQLRTFGCRLHSATIAAVAVAVPAIEMVACLAPNRPFPSTGLSSYLDQLDRISDALVRATTSRRVFIPFLQQHYTRGVWGGVKVL
jgi:hypothetical protein